MVSGPSIGELVIDDLLSSLREIGGQPQYEHDVSEAVFHNGNPLQSTSYPALFLVDEGEVHVEGPENRVPNGLTSVHQKFAVVGVVLASEAGWQTDVRRLLVDAAAKLREDITRGGVALSTQVGGMTISDSGIVAAEIPFGLGSIPVVVTHRHLTTDPTSTF